MHNSLQLQITKTIINCQWCYFNEYSNYNKQLHLIFTKAQDNIYYDNIKIEHEPMTFKETIPN